MSDVIRELLISIGLGGDADEKLEGLDKKISELGKHVKEFGETFIAALGIEKLGEFVEGQAKAGAEILHTSERLGIATDELQKWQYVAGQNGLSSQSMAGSLKLLERNMGNAAVTGSRMGRAFEGQGIAIKNADGSMRGVSDVLTDIADAVQKTPEGAERTAMAMKLMGRQGAAMIPMLSQGSEAIHKQMEEAEALGGILSKEYLESAHKAEQESQKLSFAWKGMKASLANELFPAFSKIMELFSKGIAIFHKLTDNTTFFRVALMAAGAVAAYTVVPAMLSLAKAFLGVAAGEAVALWPLLGMVVAFAVLAIAAMAAILIFDDLWAMFEGKDSLIGALIDKFYGLGATKQLIQDLKDAWHEFSNTMLEAGINLGKFPNVSFLFEPFIRSVKVAIQTVTGLIKAVTTVIKLLNHLQTVYDRMGTNGLLLEMRGLASGDKENGSASIISRGLASVMHAVHKPVGTAAYNGAVIKPFTRPAATTNHVTINQHGVHGENVGEKTAQAVRDANEENDNANAVDALGQPEADEGID